MLLSACPDTPVQPPLLSARTAAQQGSIPGHTLEMSGTSFSLSFLREREREREWEQEGKEGYDVKKRKTERQSK